LSATVIQLFCAAQKNKHYDLMLSSGVVSLPANFEKINSLPLSQGDVFNGKYYRYIQFYLIPSAEQKKQLIEKGIELLLYLPTNTYIASLKQNVNLNELSAFGIRGVYSIKPEYKLLNELNVAISENNFPGYAVKGNNIGISFTSYGNIPFDEMKSFLKAKGYNITFEDKSMHWFVVWVKKDEILDFVNQAFVCSAELVDDVPQPENNVGRTSHRSNSIATDYSGGRKYNGTGSKLCYKMMVLLGHILIIRADYQISL